MYSKDTKENTISYPVLALRGLPIFPHAVVHFDVGREISVNAIEKAMAGDKKIVIAAQIDPDVDQPQSEDLYTVGTLCTIKQVLRIAEDNLRILINGESRVVIEEFTSFDSCIECTARIEESSDILTMDDEILADAYVRELKKASSEYFPLVGRLPDEVNISFAKETDPFVCFRQTCIFHASRH